MPNTQSLNITLPFEMAEIIKNKVLSGEYASESEVIHDELLALAEHNTAIEKWLHEEVLPTIDAINADPSQLLSAEEAWKQLNAYMNK